MGSRVGMLLASHLARVYLNDLHRDTLIHDHFGFGRFLLCAAASGTAAASTRAAAASTAASALAACTTASFGLVGGTAAATTVTACSIDFATAAAAAAHGVVLGAAASIIIAVILFVSAASGTLDAAHTCALATSAALLFGREGTILGRFGRGLAATAGTDFLRFGRKDGAPKDRRRICHHDGKCGQGRHDEANAADCHKGHAHPMADFKGAAKFLTDQPHAPEGSRRQGG